MGDFAQQPEAISGLVPKLCRGQKSRRAEAATLEAARDEAVPGCDEEFAPRPR